MTDWLRAFNPTSPITTEAEAEGAARASAVAMFIGAAVMVASVAWTLANPGAIQAALDAAGNTDPQTAAAAAATTQIGLWTAGGFAVLQAILGFVQWRNPGKMLAILFIALVGFGIVANAASPLLAGMAPNMPVTPMWQIVLSLAILVVQLVLLIAGLRGINRLDQLQMDGAR